jgi:PAS domain S-box-containing protein
MSDLDFLAGGAQMGALIRSIDWSKTPLGPPGSWSLSLRMMVTFLLANRFPLLLWWGPEYVQIYNDAYRPIPGTKHPQSMGQRARDCWPEIWHIIGPLIDTPFRGGPATWSDDLALEVHRHGFTEETHCTVAYSPVPDETAPGGIGGVLATVHETTPQIVQQRRVVVLRDLGARAMEAKSAEEACVIAAQALAQHPRDVPFALIYLLDGEGTTARLAASAGIEMGTPASARVVDLTRPGTLNEGWPLARAASFEQAQLVSDLAACFGPAVPAGPWSDPPSQALVLSIPSNIQHRPAGILVAGVSIRLELDELYRSFFELATTQVATAIANARAYEEERKRAEALAEIDRAKTLFFSNVSHEFRTPLTLMLGPLEDLLRSEHGVGSEARAQLDVMHRNGLRLLKLVNTLLDFARIEAGRAQASYEPVDLCAFTAELGGVFRSAIERAGLRFNVECQPLPDVAYVDREMWEKVILNLLSNAFKFTFEGEITLAVRRAGDGAEVSLRDTGVGIAAEELPRLFERFHRVRGARSRSHEGTGIGLALVRELVRLHGGTVRIESEPHRGTTFTIALPLGKAHLPLERIGAARTLASTALTGHAYVEEAARWLPDDVLTEVVPTHDTSVASAGSRVLVADDNADMREYLRRLLGAHWTVETVADGAAALTAARERPPDLVLTDVMMPRLDGFELLRALRAEPRTATVPVVLLSARAGEESKLEGLDAGADDYLIKPFSAHELIARVNVHLQLGRMRRETGSRLREARERFETLLNEAPLGVYLVDADFRIREVNPTARRAFGDIPDLIGRDVGDVIRALWPRAYADDIIRRFRNTLETGEPYVTAERIERRHGRGVTETYEWQINRIMLPEARYGVVCYFRDISASVAARQAIAESEARYRGMVTQSFAGIAETDATGRFTAVNDRYCEITGYSREELLDRRRQDITHPDDLPRSAPLFERLVAGGEPFEIEKRYVRKDGSSVWVHNSVSALRDAAGTVRSTFAVCIDITERKHAEDALRAADRAKDDFLAMLSHELRTPLTSMAGWVRMLRRGTLDPAQTARAIESIDRNTVAQARLIDDLLDVSRIVSGKLQLDVRPVDLIAVVESAIDSVRHEARNKGVDLDTDLDPAAGPVWGDQTRLGQVVVNLLTNAVKFTPTGGRITLRLTRAGAHAVLTVADTGPGIDRADLPHIFERFRQAEGRASRRPHTGLGLGLSIAQSIVERHKGTIAASSEGVGHGATFTVTLPLMAVRMDAVDDDHETSSRKPATTAPRTAVLGGLRIVIVDDDSDARDLLALVLQQAGAQVVPVGSVAEAVATVERQRPDVLISDIAMPSADGYDLIARIRKTEAGGQPRLPLIALTAYASREDRTRALATGFDAYLVKPVDPTDLLRALRVLAIDRRAR